MKSLILEFLTIIELKKSCPVEKRNRRHCSACRFNKCISVGMKKECIMSDQQILKKVGLLYFYFGIDICFIFRMRRFLHFVSFVYPEDASKINAEYVGFLKSDVRKNICLFLLKIFLCEKILTIESLLFSLRNQKDISHII